MVPFSIIFVGEFCVTIYTPIAAASKMIIFLIISLEIYCKAKSGFSGA